MKHAARITAVAGFIALALGCNSTSSTSASTPTPTPSQAGTSTVKFTAQLAANNEVPAITGAESNGAGSATITFNVTKDATGTITAVTADFSVTLNGFPSNTPINLAHIHPGAAGQTGGVLVNTGLASGQVVLSDGTGSFTKTGVSGFSTADAQSIINNPSGYYFNVHSAANPGGVARGQLVKQ
jgi:hypothetical protein